MTANWNWRKHTGGPTIEFQGYTDFASMTPVRGLVRETIQNAYDARRKDGSGKYLPVKMSFRFGMVSDGVRDKYLNKELTEHLHAGLVIQEDDHGHLYESLRDHKTATWKEKLTILEVSDRNTTGLNGDITKTISGKVPDPENVFRQFHHSWGVSDGDATRGGSWGYGKAVTPFASKIKSFFALSVRDKGTSKTPELDYSLMGQAIIKNHYVAHSDDLWLWHGYYSLQDTSPEKKDLALTSSQQKEVDEFIDNFNIQDRTLTEEDRGLSLIIPYPKDDITPVEIAREVLINYVHLIVSGNLEVEIIDSRTGSAIWNLKASNSMQWLDANDKNHGELLEWSGKTVDALKAVCELQLDFYKKSMSVVTLSRKLKFSDGPIPNFEEIFKATGKSIQDEIHSILVHQSKQGIVEVNVIFEIEKTDGVMEDACVTFYIRPCSSTQATALFRGPIRVIGEEGGATVPSFVASLHVPSEVEKCKPNGLYKFLRLAEGPAHLNWESVKSGGKASASYQRPTHIRQFVVKAVPNFIDAAMAVTKLTPVGMGFISISLNGKKGTGKSGGGKGGKPKGPRKDDPPLVGTKTIGSTTFKFSDPKGDYNGRKIKFESSYQPWTSGSSPWSKMAIAEFDMKMSGGTHPITVASAGGCVSGTPSGNMFIVEVLDDTQFEVTIAGFDDALERVHRFTWEA